MTVGETLIDYELLTDINKAIKSGLFEQGDNSENEDRHVSAFDELMKPLDEKEVYIVTRNLVRYHRRAFARTLHYLEKEGELKE